MKKGFAYFLIIYILTLVFVPCVDKDIQFSGGMYELNNQDQSGDNHDHHDCCSPLCTCSCCSLPFETARTFVVTQDFTRPMILMFFFDPQIESHYHFSIWEPPKA